MSENITFPNDPPVDGDQFTVGNTTYAWDSAPGVWRAFVTATSSSSSGGAEAFPSLSKSSGTTLNLLSNGTITLTPGTWFIHRAATTDVGSTFRTITIPNENIVWGFGVMGTSNGQAFAVNSTTGDTFVRFNGTGQPWIMLQVSADTVVSTGTSGSNTWNAYQWSTETTGGGGGSSTTVNIGGGGDAISLAAEIPMQTITTSGTLAAGDFTSTGPAWVVVSGGAGGGSNCVSNQGLGRPGGGGDGGSYAFFVDDVTDLVGGVLTAGAGGAGGALLSGGLDPGGQTICNDGSAGSTTTFVINGTTITATGGTGGRGSAATATEGTDGTSSASGGTPPTELTITELNDAIDVYWEAFVIANQSTGALTIASFLASLDGAQGPGGALQNSSSAFISGQAGQAGGLYILYQNQ